MQHNRTKLMACGMATVVVLALYAPSAFCEGPAKKDLAHFYRGNCAKCHGPDGSGRDADGNNLSGNDLTDKRWREKTKDAKMVKTILKGKFFGWAMPAFKNALTEEEARRMVTEIIRKAVKGKTIGLKEAE